MDDCPRALFWFFSYSRRFCVHGTCTGRYDEESGSYESNHVIPVFIQPYFGVLPPSSPLNHRYELQQEPKVGITTFIKVGITIKVLICDKEQLLKSKTKKSKNLQTLCKIMVDIFFWHHNSLNAVLWIRIRIGTVFRSFLDLDPHMWI